MPQNTKIEIKKYDIYRYFFTFKKLDKNVIKNDVFYI